MRLIKTACVPPASTFEKELMIDDEQVQTHEPHPYQLKIRWNLILNQNCYSAIIFDDFLKPN